MNERHLLHQLLKQEVLDDTSKYATGAGFYLSRNLPAYDSLANTPWADFIEDTHNPSHKKCPIDENGKSKGKIAHSQQDNLIGLAEGTLALQRNVVAEGFQWYSAAIVTFYINLCLYSQYLTKKYKTFVPATKEAILSCPHASPKIKKHLKNKLMFLRYIAFIVYEGQGLCGYTENIWAFWSLFTGKGTYTSTQLKEDSPLYVSPEEAMQFSINLNLYQQEYLKDLKDKGNPNSVISIQDNKAFSLFKERWEILSGPTKPSSIIKNLYLSWTYCDIYRKLERNSIDLDIIPDKVLNTAVLCGFFRRASKGIITSNSIDILSLDFSLNYIDSIHKQDLVESIIYSYNASLSQSKEKLAQSIHDIPLSYIINEYSNNSNRPFKSLITYLQILWDLYSYDTNHRGHPISSLSSLIMDGQQNLIPFSELLFHLYKTHILRAITIKSISDRKEYLNSLENSQDAAALIQNWIETGASFSLR